LNAKQSRNPRVRKAISTGADSISRAAVLVPDRDATNAPKRFVVRTEPTGASVGCGEFKSLAGDVAVSLAKPTEVSVCHKGLEL